MNVHFPCLNIARFVLETRSPLSISSGRSSMCFDTMIVRDANGLPGIPGTSLAGVLKHLYAREFGNGDDIFGMAEGDSGEASRLYVSWGCLNDSSNHPVEGLLLGRDGEERLTDSLLAYLMTEAPILRRRVRMNERGAADTQERGLFDRSAVPAGTRFSFEICLYSSGHEDAAWKQIRDLFGHPGFRLGGSTRAGMGNVRCVQWHECHLDLRNPEDYQAYSALPATLEGVQGMKKIDVGDRFAPQGWYLHRIQLKPDAGWRIGGTSVTPLHKSAKKDPDDVPHHEAMIVWHGDRATLHSKVAVAPASSIKGALAHRVAFHANCLMKKWESDALIGEANPAVSSLFGSMADGDQGCAGRVFVEDAFLFAEDHRTPKVHWQMHTSLDRFTGGVRDKVLFGEEILWRESLDLNVWVNDAGLDDLARKAWRLALDDLKEGRLSLGGGMARGHGWFAGEEFEHAA